MFYFRGKLYWALGSGSGERLEGANGDGSGHRVLLRARDDDHMAGITSESYVAPPSCSCYCTISTVYKYLPSYCLGHSRQSIQSMFFFQD